MTDSPDLSFLPDDLLSRLRTRAAESGVEPATILGDLLDSALDLNDIDLVSYEGASLVNASNARSAYGVYFQAQQVEQGDGEADEVVREELRADLQRSLRSGSVPCDVIARHFEIGRGAQGDPTTFLQLVAAVGNLALLPAALINQWGTALPVIRSWLTNRGLPGGVTLELVKAWCLQDAKSKVADPDEIVPAFVSGHRATAVTTLNDVEHVGPFVVSILVPARNACFVYVTDDLGRVLHFFEAPGPSEEEVIAGDNS